MAQENFDRTNDIRVGFDFGCRHNTHTGYKTGRFHMHPHYEFYLFIRGNIQIIIEDERYDTHPMDLFIFPPGTLHLASITDSEVPYERAYFYATRKVLSEMSDPTYPLLDIVEHAVRNRDYSFHADDVSAGRFIRLIDDYLDEDNEKEPCFQQMNRCRIHMLSLIVCRVMQHKQILDPHPSERISEVIRYINDHILDSLTLDSLAEHFYISKYTLLHEFKSYANISVHQYILFKRVTYAQHLMQHGISPGLAAKQSGFNDYAGFYRAFIRHNSITPQEYYNQALKSGIL
ncbi:MAG: helix-turn-helix transcriptional regulator [Clostridia bacterium]|nr:helix-turn-helix transcriptional regulator [Clostridia bacterium]